MICSDSSWILKMNRAALTHRSGIVRMQPNARVRRTSDKLSSSEKSLNPDRPSANNARLTPDTVPWRDKMNGSMLRGQNAILNFSGKRLWRIIIANITSRINVTNASWPPGPNSINMFIKVFFTWGGADSVANMGIDCIFFVIRTLM